MQKVMIHPANYDGCQEAVNQAFLHFPVEIEGKSVLIKPNVLRGAAPEQCITTHPAVLAAVLEKVKSLNPKSIQVGDNPGMFSYGANEGSFEKAGLLKASGKLYTNIGGDTVQVDFIPGFYEKLNISRAVMEADVIISVPKFKTHGLTMLSGAIKNSYGIIPGAVKAKLHALTGNAMRFNEIIVDVFNIRVPDLFIVDAIVGMEGNGPASTELRYIGQVMASDNAVALDATIARMMGADLNVLHFLTTAQARGLGNADENGIEIIGELKPIDGFRLPPNKIDTTENPQAVVDFFHSRSKMRPVVDENRCTACETCVEQCPVSALKMIDALPKLDDTICIACFCCQEMCPDTAITLA